MTFSLNNAATWGTKEVHQPPSSFNVAAFQAKLDKIFGLAPNGMPIVRLVWAGDIAKCYSRFYTEWTNAGFGTESELRAKYRYATIKIPGTTDYIDIPPPRWIIEDREDASRYASIWQQTRWQNGKEMRPPPPLDGYYCHLMTIAKHDASCCNQAKEDRVVCWGQYRKPDARDLAMLNKARQARDADVHIPLDRPLSEQTMELVGRDANNRALKRAEYADDQMKQMVDDNALELISQATGIDLSDKTKKFSIPSGMTQKESGLIVPK